MPVFRKFSVSSWLTDRPIAHRGLHDAETGVIENTAAAFEAAAGAGHPVELDVHALKDGRAAVFHDLSLKRLAGVDEPITAQDEGSLKRLRINGTDQRILMLGEVFEIIAGRVPILIEVKSSAKLGVAEKAVATALKTYKGECAVQSFNPWSMGWFADHAPKYERGQIAGAFEGEGRAWISRFLRRRLLLNQVSRPRFINHETICLDDFPVRLLRKLGFPILTWTVKTKDDLARIEGKCDNYLFDDGFADRTGGADA